MKKPYSSALGGVDLLEEWKVAYAAAMHFNDLLMRLRTLGLPAIITITGGATAYTLNINSVSWGMKQVFVGIILFVLSICLTWLVHWLFGRDYVGKSPGGDEVVKSICLQKYEKHMWRIVLIVTYFFTAAFWIRKWWSMYVPEDVSIGVFLIAFGLILLVSFYVLDRFYYYCLLIGAVTRLQQIESVLSFEVTATISKVAPRRRSAVVITAFYFLPGIIGYTMLLTILVFT